MIKLNNDGEKAIKGTTINKAKYEPILEYILEQFALSNRSHVSRKVIMSEYGVSMLTINNIITELELVKVMQYVGQLQYEINPEMIERLNTDGTLDWYGAKI